MANWYKKGQDGWQAAKEENEAAKQRRSASRDPRRNRFWLENDQSAKVTFLDTPKFFIHEHNIKIDGRWGNYETCLKDFATCPICESGMNSSYVVVGTVISHKVWTDKEGNKHTNEKLLFVAKGRARDKLGRQIQLRDGDLAGAVYEIARGSSNTECATGEDFEFLGRLETAKLAKLAPKDSDPKEWLKPYDYTEIFQPKSAEELRKIMGVSAPPGAEEYDSSKESAPLPGTDDEEDDAGGEVSSIDELL